MGKAARTVALAFACLMLANSVVRAEFEIPQVDGEKGEIEVEYRGARHWGPASTTDDAIRQSHEVEFQYAVADWWMVRATPNVEQPFGGDIEFVSVGLETQFVLVPRDGGSFGLALMIGYGPFSEFVDDEPDEFEFGPVVELSQGRWLATLNPVLVEQIDDADQEALGLEYAAQLQYRFASHWSVAALGFGEIEDLANAGPANEQEHLLGSGVYWFSRPYFDDDGVESDDKAEWVVGVGALFGLTDSSSDVAVRATASLEY